MAEPASLPRPSRRAVTLSFVTAARGLLFGLAVGVLLAFVAETSTFARVRLMALDVAYRARAPIPFRTDLGYIDFDDTSIQLFGKWVWPRSRQVALIRTLDLYDAKALGYDVFFTEHNDIHFTPRLVERALGRPETLAENVGAVDASFRDFDAEMEDAIRNAGNVYLAEFMGLPDAHMRGNQEAIRAACARLQEGFSDERREALAIAGQYALPADSAIEANLFKSVEVVTPLGRFGEAAAGIGFAQIIEDLDKTVRLYPLFIHYDGKAFPSIAVSILSQVLQVPLERITIRPGEYVEFPDARIFPDPGFGGAGATIDAETATLRIPVDAHGQMLVNWAGRFLDRGLHVSFRDISALYALNAAKEVARRFPPEPDAAPVIREAVRTALADEGMVSPDDADRIGRQVALARIVEARLVAGADAAEARAFVESQFGGEQGWGIRDPAIWQVVPAVAAAFAVERGADPGAALDETWTAEIRRNVEFFRERDRLDDVRPLLFPPPFTALHEAVSRPFSPVDISGRIFMAGLTGEGTIDLNPMPFEKSCPMVALHLHALNTVLTRQFLRFPIPGAGLAALIALSMIAGVLGALLSPSRSFAACALVAGGYLYLVHRAWADFGLWVDSPAPALGVAVTWMGEVVVAFVKASLEKQKVRGIFSTMVSPKVLKKMEENPNLFSLTGERKQATIFFSSIDGFGEVMKREAPDELTHILGFYLTPVSEIIMDYDGYIDKYEGHVIMADFGVPLDDPDHAWKCCFAAVEQQMDIEAFRTFVLARYGAEVRVSMGINSGFISAGNMGSEKKMQYTVMGDAVNIAARFRPANAIYGTGIITGEAMEPLVRDVLELRLLDRLLLKGKTKPTTLYEIMGWKAEAYRERHRGRPVPAALLSRWRDCPGEKVFGFIATWRRIEHEHGLPLAGEIAAFFESQVGVVERAIVAGASLSIPRISGEIDRLAGILSSIDGGAESFAAPAAAEGTPAWKLRLLEWVARIEALRNRVRRAREKNLPVPPGHPSLPELDLILDTYHGKVSLLAENLGKRPKSGIETVAKALAAMRDELEGRPLEGAREILERHTNLYRDAVSGFYRSLARRPADYHETMAVAGSIPETRRRVRVLFEEALGLHWDRKWDEALERLAEALSIDPHDGPSIEFRSRIENYRNDPPGETWQGEFVQRKK